MRSSPKQVGSDSAAYLDASQAAGWIRLLDQMPVSVITTDAAGLVTSWNRHAQFLFGWSAAETIGRPLTRFTIDSSDVSVLAPLVSAVTRGDTWEGTLAVSRRDGHRVLVHAVDAPLFDDNAVLSAVLCLSVALGDATPSGLSNFASSDVPGVRPQGIPSYGATISAVALTRRERELIALLQEQQSGRQIAEMLGISYATVRNHTASLYRKFQVHSRRELLDRIRGA